MRTMDTAAFIDEVAHRLVEYISSNDGAGRVNPAASLETMRRTLDVQLPLQGHGLDAVLDDLDTFIANSVKTHRPEFIRPTQSILGTHLQRFHTTFGNIFSLA